MKKHLLKLEANVSRNKQIIALGDYVAQGGNEVLERLKTMLKVKGLGGSSFNDSYTAFNALDDDELTDLYEYGLSVGMNDLASGNEVTEVKGIKEEYSSSLVNNLLEYLGSDATEEDVEDYLDFIKEYYDVYYEMQRGRPVAFSYDTGEEVPSDEAERMFNKLIDWSNANIANKILIASSIDGDFDYDTYQDLVDSYTSNANMSTIEIDGHEGMRIFFSDDSVLIHDFETGEVREPTKDEKEKLVYTDE